MRLTFNNCYLKLLLQKREKGKRGLSLIIDVASIQSIPEDDGYTGLIL
jgi:hypothetical protein